jgi:anti-sigma B factor antagonist
MTLTVLPSPARTAVSVPSALTTIVRAEGTRTVVVLQGEADFSTRPVLSDALSRAIALGAGDVVIDLAEASFIDTASVRALALSRELLDRDGRRVTFRSPSRLAARVLGLFGLTELIEARQLAEL